MNSTDSFTIVVPTRDNPSRCQQMLESLIQEGEQAGLALRVVFLVNDIDAGACGELQKVIEEQRFSSLQPRLLQATRNHLTVEENILHTLGENLDEVDEHFLIIGNTDRVNLGALKGAIDYLREQQLDLLLVGWLNCEAYQGRVIRQLNLTPRHLYPRNRIGPGKSHGPEIFADFLTDYGPEGHLSYIGCQMYTKHCFKEVFGILASLPEPLYAIPIATLELTTRQPRAVGFWPEVTVYRIDHLLYGADSDEQPPQWWIPLSRTSRGLSRHCVLSIIANSLQVSTQAFSTLVNCQMVCNRRATPHLEFTNFLFAFVEQMRNIVQNCPNHTEWHYSARELEDIVRFGERLGTVDIGLAEAQREPVSKWLQAFSVIGDYSDPNRVRNLMAGATPVLLLLDARPGMERWTATLNS